MGQKYAAYAADPGPVTGYYDSEDSPVPAGVQAIMISDQDWLNAIQEGGAAAVIAGKLSLPSAGQVWKNGAWATPTPSLSQQAAALLAGGLSLTSTGTPALDGTYAVSSGVQFGRDDIATEAQFVSTFSEFTNGTTTLSWPLIDGKTFVTFPTTAAFLNFAKAAAQFYAAVQAAVATGGTLPAASATIP